MARGATNQKGPERALLNAIEAIIAVTVTLPVNLMVTAEGEEELGSPHYPQIVARLSGEAVHSVAFTTAGADDVFRDELHRAC